MSTRVALVPTHGCALVFIPVLPNLHITCTVAHTHSHIHTHTRIDTHSYTYTRTDTCTHAYTHIHTCSQTPMECAPTSKPAQVTRTPDHILTGVWRSY